jgi:hypothetical protein
MHNTAMSYGSFQVFTLSVTTRTPSPWCFIRIDVTFALPRLDLRRSSISLYFHCTQAATMNTGENTLKGRKAANRSGQEESREATRNDR